MKKTIIAILLIVLSGCEKKHPEHVPSGGELAGIPADTPILPSTDIDYEDVPLKTENGMHVKVVVTNQKTPVYKNPKADTITSSLNYFDILYVHRKMNVGMMEFYNVSFSPDLKSEIGWISDSDCVVWNHRGGFRPIYSEKTGINSILFYDSADDAFRSLEGVDVEPTGMFEIPQVKSKNPYSPWIILEKKTMPLGDQSISLYKVLCLGKKKADEKKKRGYTPKELDFYRDSVKNVDFCFVIDGTGSMSDDIAAVKSAVGEMAKTFDKCQINIRFTLTVYRDVCDGPTKMFEYFGLETLDGFLNHINSIEAVDGGDTPERGFPAIQDTLLMTEFRENSTRLLVLVGDAPFHVTGKNNPKNLKNGDIISLAKLKNTRIFILDVGTELSKQVGAIAHSTGGAIHQLGSSKKLEKEVTRILTEQSNDVTETLSRMADIIKHREIDPEKLSASTGKTPEEITHVINILKSKGVDMERLRNGEAITLTGWIIPQVGSVSLGRLEVFLNYTEGETCLRTMQYLLRVNPDVTIGLQIRNHGGEGRIQSGSVQEFFDENSIPHNGGSILSHSVDTLRRLPESQRIRLQDELVPYIRDLDGCLKDSSKWERVHGRVRGWIPEEVLP